MNFVIDTSQIDHFRSETTKLGYDAVHSSPRRRDAPISSKSEDRELTTRGRQALSSKGRDLARNLSLAGFVIRKHCQYVAKADFKCSIPGQPKYNALVKKFIGHWSRREHCDLSQRHSLPDLLYLWEIHRIIDGDVAIVKLSNGRLQSIEGDRLRNPPEPQKGDGYEWIHGVKVGRNNQAFKYAVHCRNAGSGFTFERTVPAENMLLCGYFNRLDQIRGVSLLAPAINQFQDVYEGIEYALAKAKLSQKLGLLTKRENDHSDPEDYDEFGKKITAKTKEIFGSGVMHLDFGEKDDAKIIESATPSTQFQQFIHNVIQIAFAALDIPYSFFDGSKTNYYGIRGAHDDYIESCQQKQRGLINVLHELTDWRLRNAILDGELPPPPDGMTVEELLWHCDWIGVRLPIWRLIDDAKGYMIANDCGFLTPRETTGLYGQDFDENLAEMSEIIKYAKTLDVPLPFGQEKKQNLGF